jgi:hypothetical protein
MFEFLPNDGLNNSPKSNGSVLDPGNCVGARQDICEMSRLRSGRKVSAREYSHLAPPTDPVRRGRSCPLRSEKG